MSKAKAPRPGVGKRIEEAKAGSKLLQLRIKDETRDLAVGAIPMKDRAVIRRELEGTSAESYIMQLDQGTVSIDTIWVLWFLAGRQSDPRLSYADDYEEFERIVAGVTGPEDIDARIIEPADVEPSPEA